MTKSNQGTGPGIKFVGFTAMLAATLLLSFVNGVKAAGEATAVGSDTCLSCHASVERHFKNDIHATVDLKKDETIPENACESCHGLGSLHAESSGKRKFIARENPSNCLNCHTDVLAKLKLQHHHPVLEGRVGCSDCHTMHGKDSRTTTIDELKGGQDTACLKCHKEVKGPYVFEHDAMREGCTACHAPHGSVQDKMLVGGQTTTCLRCHYDLTTNGDGNLSGGVAHGSTLSTTGTGTGNYDIGRGEECVDHHRAPHGSNIWRTFNR